MGVLNRNFFLQIISNNIEIRSLPLDKKKDRINWILNDLETAGLFEPINFEEDDLDLLADLHFGDLPSINFLLEMISGNRQKEKRKDEEKNVLSCTSLQRIRKKRIELARRPEMNIILDETDYMTDDLVVSGNPMDCSYGRTSLHEAIHLRDLTSIEKLAKERKYLKERDNNGNTPYEMAYYQKYKEAMKILKKYMDS
ncbi:hypothetical protein LCGC14_2570280 [marine sediment metagenome]|uniref:Uncharacterized protein n=1 Tax=marine sediment metagenome TaxID=412755 RepID=A0A0F9B5A9_9ZZZZ